MNRQEAHHRYKRSVNPGKVELLEALDFGRLFVRAEGCRLWDDQGREYLDFLSGFGVHNIGHNHPRLCEALCASLAQTLPSMLNIDAPVAQTLLAERLTALTHPSLCRIAWANSGAEAVEMAIKTARAATGRETLLSCTGAYHGLTTGALSLMDDPGHRKPFGALPGKTVQIPFHDINALQNACRRHRPAVFFVEPVQGEGGIHVPAANYLANCAEICRKEGCLLAIDEIQTGLGRTGPLFATDFSQVVPDLLMLGKALSGGIVPVAACLIGEQAWEQAFGSAAHCHLNASTFAGGQLAMTAGLTVLDILADDHLCARAATTGAFLRIKLNEIAAKHKMILDVRGAGLLFGVEFQPARGLLMRAVPAWARQSLYAQVVSALLLQDHGIITQPCSLKQNVLRLEPPLGIGEAEVTQFCAALDEVLRKVPTQNAALRSAFRKSILRREL